MLSGGTSITLSQLIDRHDPRTLSSIITEGYISHNTTKISGSTVKISRSTRKPEDLVEKINCNHPGQNCSLAKVI